MHKRFGIHGSLLDWGSFIIFFKDRLWKIISISVLKILTWNLVLMQSRPSATKYCAAFVVRPEMSKYGPVWSTGGPRIRLKWPKIIKSWLSRKREVLKQCHLMTEQVLFFTKLLLFLYSRRHTDIQFTATLKPIIITERYDTQFWHCENENIIIFWLRYDIKQTI